MPPFQRNKAALWRLAHCLSLDVWIWTSRNQIIQAAVKEAPLNQCARPCLCCYASESPCVRGWEINGGRKARKVSWLQVAGKLMALQHRSSTEQTGSLIAENQMFSIILSCFFVFFLNGQLYFLESLVLSMTAFQRADTHKEKLDSGYQILFWKVR